MTSFRSRSLVAAFALLLAGPALGQGTVAGPAVGGNAESVGNPFAPVESQPLGEVEASLVGTLGAAEGGFEPTMWAGTERAVVEALLPRLPVAQSSPTLTDLARRLLLSRAQTPTGSTTGRSLLAVRLDRALAFGQAGAIEAMAQQVRAEMDSLAVAAVRVDAMLYQGNDDDACALAERMRGRDNDAAWTKRLAFCSALAGRVSEARLGVDVLSDTGAGDEAFAALMAKWVDKAKLKSLHIDNPQAVHLAMLRRSDVAIDDATLTRANLAFLTAWAAYEKAPLPQRLSAGEIATASGVLPIDTLSALYRQASFKPEQLTAPFDAKAMPPGPLGAAYVVQRLDETDDTAARAALVAAAIDASKSRGALPAVAAVLRPVMTSLDPSPGLLASAGSIGLGEVMAGEGAHSRRWYELASHSGAREQARALRSLVAIRGDVPELAWTSDAFLTRIRYASGADKSRAALEWSLMRSLGTAQNEAVWIATLDAPSTFAGMAPSSSVSEGLKAAAAGDRIGETVLFTLLALGLDGARAAHPAAIALAVAALSQSGLSNEARSLATEALAWRMP